MLHRAPRRARAAAVNIIPTTTGAARTTGVVVPELDGRLDGVAVRVRVEDGSLTDLTLLLTSSVDADDVNDELRSAAEGPLAGVLRYSTEPSSRATSSATPRGRLVKVFGWYDNEFGYASRLADVATYLARRL